MALSTLLLPSSTSTASDTSDRQSHQHQHHSKRKKKPPPPLPPPSLWPTRRTRSAGSHRAMAAAVSKKSPKASTKLIAAKNHHHHRRHSRKEAAATPTPTPAASSSWEQLKSVLSCRSATSAARLHDRAAPSALARFRSRDTAPLTRSSRRAHRAASSTCGGHPSSLRGLSGCYECRAINVEPMSRRYPWPRELCACSQCGEAFTKADSLEHHQVISHAVSELGPEDSGRNIVEIIFKSSWQKRDRPICQIDRILKVHNTPRTIARFEAYRDAVRSRCRAAAARAAADGNELLRFHSAGLTCSLGLDGSTSLCADSSSTTTIPNGGVAASCGACGVCAAMRHGFAPWVGAHPLGVRTTASSGRAHDCGAAAPAQAANAGCRAMLVCRVIAGRVRRDGDAATAGEEEEGPFDSVAGEHAASSVYGNLEELFVANPRAILTCFVVIYRVLD